MITVSAERIFKGVNELLAGESELPPTADWVPIRGHIDLSIGEAWNSEWWQFLMRGEYRYFRLLWSAASSYDKGDEVYDAATQQYFQCLRDAVTGAGQSPTDSAGDERSDYWALCKPSYAGSNWSSASVAYAVGDIIYYPVDDLYYQCHTANTSSTTLTPDAAGGDERWGALAPFVRYVEFAQAGKTLIGDVMDVKDSNPRVTRRWKSIDKETLEDRVYVLDNVKRVWLDFRLRRPQLTGNFYDETEAYAVGAQVYFTPSTAGAVGNFYDCVATASAGDTPETDADKWDLVELPQAFEGFLIWSAYSKLLTSEDEPEERQRAISMAEGYLLLETDRKYRQAGETPNVPMRTYP
jgi:hypothetical protein